MRSEKAARLRNPVSEFVRGEEFEAPRGRDLLAVHALDLALLPEKDADETGGADEKADFERELLALLLAHDRGVGARPIDAVGQSAVH